MAAARALFCPQVTLSGQGIALKPARSKPKLERRYTRRLSRASKKERACCCASCCRSCCEFKYPILMLLFFVACTSVDHIYAMGIGRSPRACEPCPARLPKHCAPRSFLAPAWYIMPAPRVPVRPRFPAGMLVCIPWPVVCSLSCIKCCAHSTIHTKVTLVIQSGDETFLLSVLKAQARGRPPSMRHAASGIWRLLRRRLSAA